MPHDSEESLELIRWLRAEGVGEKCHTILKAWALPGLWLLLLGHSFYVLGGLAFDPFRVCGLIFQIGGVAALWPGGEPLVAFAVTTFLGNLWLGVGVWRELPRRTPSGNP